jgi:hypothetical protein
MYYNETYYERNIMTGDKENKNFSADAVKLARQSGYDDMRTHLESLLFDLAFYDIVTEK